MLRRPHASAPGTKPPDFEDKTRRMEQSISQLEKKFGGRRNIPTAAIVAIAAPVLIFGILFTIKPRFTQTVSKKGEAVRDRRKLAKWTLAFTFAVYAVIFILYCFQNSPRGGGVRAGPSAYIAV